VPSSGAIKPKPLSLLNHFTVPCAILFFFFHFSMDVRTDIPVNRITGSYQSRIGLQQKAFHQPAAGSERAAG
jgi:hypothetical protein